MHLELLETSFDYSIFDTDTSLISRSRIFIQPYLTFRTLNIIDVPIRLLVDTGATEITLPASALGLYDKEKFVHTYNEAELTHRYGIVSTEVVDYYKIILDEIRIGDIIIKGFPISITFDTRVSMALLGMSFLGLFDITINPAITRITFKETIELAKYTHKNKALTDPLNVCKNEYMDLSDSTKHITKEDLMALSVNNMIKQNSK